MITEDYVSFETAKLLKEKGFNEGCLTYYLKNSLGLKHFVRAEYLTNDDLKLIWENVEFCSAPTLQMTCKWLREVHGIDIIIEISNPSVKDRKYYCMIWDGNNNSYILDLFNSYEEACEEAIKYVLENLI